MNDRLARGPGGAISVVPSPRAEQEERVHAHDLDFRDARRAHDGPRERLPLHPTAIRQCEEIQTRLWLGYADGSTGAITTFVGASSACGVSTVAANFAAALALGATSEVLLIRFLASAGTGRRQAAEPDLDRWLDDQCAPPRATVHTPPNMYLLTSASLGDTVAGVLRSGAFDEFLVRARERFEQIVIDAPSLQRHAESLLLCRKADGVVLVVRAGRTRSETARWARDEIVHARGNLAGVVLNRHRHYIPRWLYRLL